MPRSVLIVEDESLLARTLAKALRDAGYTAVTAESADEAARHLFPASSFDVVLLDQRLPRGSGMSILEQMRAAGMQTPVIVMTAFDTAAMRAQAQELSVSGFFRKPFNLAEMLGRIAELAGSNGDQARGSSGTAPKNGL